MNKSYNYIKNIKDKEQKVLSYYKRIYTIEQPKIFAIPKRKKGTKKNASRDGSSNKEHIEDEKYEKDKEKDKEKKDENHIKSERDMKDEKKLTKKRVVIMDD
jgi:hypothetical protein